LTTLKIAGNRIGDAGAQILAEVASLHTSLIILDISANLLTDVAGNAIVKSLQQTKKKMKTIFLHYNKFKDQAFLVPLRVSAETVFVGNQKPICGGIQEF
jgi:hypothetical protein